MRRMSQVTQGGLIMEDRGSLPGPLPQGVVIYDITGPLFFGAAERAMGALRAIGEATQVVILRLEQVPSIDATGLVAFESALEELRRDRIRAVVVGLRPQVAQAMARVGLRDEPGRLDICAGMAEAFQRLGAPLHPAVPGRPPGNA